MPPFGGVGPGAGCSPEVEERGEHAGHVSPVVRVVGLDDEQPAGLEDPVDVGQESRRHDPAMGLARVVVGLGMVEVDLGDARRRRRTRRRNVCASLTANRTLCSPR